MAIEFSPSSTQSSTLKPINPISKETETNFCHFDFGLAETENLLQISVVNQNFGQNLVPPEP